MPVMDPSQVPETQNIRAIEESGRYGGVVSEVYQEFEGKVCFTLQSKHGQHKIWMNLDAEGRPAGRDNQVMSDLLRCTNIPSAEHWQADKVQPFDYAYEDLKFRKLQFRVKWGQPSEKYPEPKLWLEEILPANAPLQAPLGPDGAPKPKALEVVDQSVPMGGSAPGAVEFGAVPF